MLDLLGREVVSRYYSSTATSGKIELSTTGLGAGTYILRLNDARIRFAQNRDRALTLSHSKIENRLCSSE